MAFLARFFNLELNSTTVCRVVVKKSVCKQLSSSALEHLDGAGDVAAENRKQCKSDSKTFVVFELWRLWHYSIFRFLLLVIWLSHY